MTREEAQRRMRIASALTREQLAGHLALFWVSFSKDGKFAGVAIVEALGPASAIRKTHQLGINPGGSVMPVEIPNEKVPTIPTDALDRLLDLETLRGYFPDLVRQDGSAI